MQALIDFFGVNAYLPHGYCLTWNPPLLWTTVISDVTMTLAYASYPFAVAYFVWKRKDLQYRWLYLIFFNGFILTCASTHLFSAITVWLPLYWAAAYAKALAAAVAVATVFALWWVIPRALNLPSPAELKVQRNAAQYSRSLIEASLDPLVTINPEGKITDVNKATEEVTGVPRASLIGSDFSDYFTEPEKARQGYKQVLAQGLVRDYPLTIRHTSGKMTDVLYNASLFKNEAGEIQGVFASARDISERKQADKQIRERMKELQAFFHLSAMTARKDLALDSIYQELANVLPESWQYPEITCARIVMGESEFRSANFGVSEWMQAAPIKVLGAVVGKLEVGYLEQKPEEDEGPFLKEERQLINAIAERVGHIIERKQLEIKLTGASAYSRSLIEASLDPLVTINPEGKITDVNKATEEVTGVARERLIGSDFSDYFTEPEKARQGYQQVLSQGLVRDYPLSLRHVSGKVTEVLYNASIFKNELGEVQGVFAAARDVTERRELERKVQERSTRLEQVLRETQEVVTILASSASEILTAISQLASGAAEAAAAVNETTTTVEEVRQTAQISSEKAKDIAEAGRNAAQILQAGQQNVKATVAGMNRIRDQMASIGETIMRLSEQSQAIGEITGTVNELAEQSNLLAVNAAIEAAKAGEQGKGFAVVAQEIKSLADQSKQATAQVRSLLSDIQKAIGNAVMVTEQTSKVVETGVAQSSQAGESIQVAVEATANVANASTQIAASSQQQVIGVDQVATAMKSISQASTQNADSTRQVESVAQSLNQLSQKLKALVEQHRE